MPGECGTKNERRGICIAHTKTAETVHGNELKSNTSKVKISLAKVPFFLSLVRQFSAYTHAQTDGRADRQTHACTQ